MVVDDVSISCQWHGEGAGRNDGGGLQYSNEDEQPVINIAPIRNRLGMGLHPLIPLEYCIIRIRIYLGDFFSSSRLCVVRG